MGTRVFVALVFFVFAGAGVWAQPEAPPGPESAVGTAEAAPVAEADLHSPRATLSTFLESMNGVRAGKEENWPAALECIYLKDLPEVEREAKGKELAGQLFEVLNAITLTVEDVPESPAERMVEVALGEEGEVSLTFRLNDDGMWRFSRSKLEQDIEELQATVVEEAAEKQAPAAGVNPYLGSPRATMETFLNGMSTWDEGGREQAILALDLSQVDKTVREEIGETTAVLLKRIMDRDRYVIYQEIPNSPDGPVYVHLRDDTDVSGTRKIEIAPLPIDEEGTAFEWRFSAATVEVAQELWDAYKERPLVSGVKEAAPEILSIQVRDWIDSHYPFLLKRTQTLENWQWLGLLVIIVLGMTVSRLMAFAFVVFLRRLFQREELRLDTKLEKGFVVPIRIALMAWVWWLSLRPLGLPSDASMVLKRAAAAVSAAALVWAIYRLVDILGGYLAEKAARTANKFDDLVVPLVVRSLKVFVFVFGLVFVADTLGLNPRAALAGVGLGGLAFALAAQDTIGNVFGSVTILFDKPFQIGDWVVIDDIDGNVEEVGIRSTRIRTFYNSLVTVPNSKLTNAVVDNYGARRYRRYKTTIGVTYATPPEKIEAFCEGIRELIRRHPYTRTDYFHVYLNDFGSSSLNILLYCFHECPDWATELRERHRLILDIIRLAERLGVEFAFPTQTLFVNTDGRETAAPLSASTEESRVLGRQEAMAIVREIQGAQPVVPPPVTFEAPGGEALERGDDDGEN